MPSPQKLGPTTVYATWWSATNASQRAQVLHRAQQVVTAEADAEPVGPLVDERQHPLRRVGKVGHQHRPLHAHGVHLVEQLVELAAL